MRRAVLGTLVALLLPGTGVAAAQTVPAPSLPVVALQQPQQQALHTVTLLVRSIYAHDDADKGANCGDFDNSGSLMIGNEKSPIAVDNGGTWHTNPWNMWQNYCSDTNYEVATNPAVPTSRKKYVGKAAVGSLFPVSGSVCEIDPTDFVFGDGSLDVKVPAVGQHRDFSLMIEGSNFGEHLRLEVRLRLTTS
ncbi:hypothetical protein D1871_12245 [Nakamurella silvestris]|nr:hypothetical protein D1871_12245 [Nakamurella silvestris]